MTDWGQPLIAVDVLALRQTGGGLSYAIHTREHAPFAGRSALPGVLLLPGESLESAARRAVTGKLHVPEAAIVSVTQFGAFDGTNRDPRGATISIGHIVVLGAHTHAEAAQWVQLGNASVDLPFDHDRIAVTGAEEVARRLWVDWSFTQGLLGDNFTTSAAIALTHQVNGQLPAPETNLSRWFKASGRVTKEGLHGRDTVWNWSELT